MQHDLSRLGNREFENLAQALAVKIIGAGVTVFGAGPDGGREATFRGQCHYPDPSPEGLWNGYGVVQAKYKDTLLGTTADTTWLKKELRKELDDWVDPKKNRRRSDAPDYLVIATNVTLSPMLESGGIDSVEAFIHDHCSRIGLRLQGWRIWHADQICRYLDDHEGIRRTYAAFVTSGDLIAQLVDLFGGTPATLGATLSAHTAMAMTNGQWIRLRESGDSANQRLRLGSVGIDLPAYIPEVLSKDKSSAADVPGVLRHLIDHADRCRRPSREDPAGPRHFVLMGGPGQGKSTITDLLVQAYRIAFLQDRPPHLLGAQATDALAQQSADFAASGLPRPSSRRWPYKVTLIDYSEAIAGGEDISLLRYIARCIDQTADMTGVQLKAWLAAWPWLLVLDGLDEVTALSVRERVLSRVSDFLTEAAAANADLMVVATTRPQGYNDEFPSDYYQLIALRALDRSEALNYAQRLVEVRHDQDEALQHAVIDRMKAAAREPTIRRLMRTPLQVTIISLLAERHRRIPNYRYGLFESYYATLYDREVNKGGPSGRLLDEQRANIDYLHQAIGLTLHERAETFHREKLGLALEEMAVLVRTKLLADEYEEAEADRLATELVKVAVHRLVQLVPGPVPGTVGFEIRSLQELMAARALTSGLDSDLIDRLRELAPYSHWRNTWLFAASRIFVQREALRDSLITLLYEMDTASEFCMMTLPGARLAVQMLDDGIAAAVPIYRRLLVARALDLVDLPPFRSTNSLAAVLFDAAQAHGPTRTLIANRLDQAAARSGFAAVHARRIRQRWQHLRLAEEGRPLAFGARRTEPEPRPLTQFLLSRLSRHDLPKEEGAELLLIAHLMESSTLEDSEHELTPERADRLSNLITTEATMNLAASARDFLINWSERLSRPASPLTAVGTLTVTFWPAGL